MSGHVVRETCSCGSEFHWAGPDGFQLGWVSKAIERWREAHKHADSAGICGNRAPSWRVGETEIAGPTCQLKAGHTGLHSDGETDGHAAHWTTLPDWTACDGKPCAFCNHKPAEESP